MQLSEDSSNPARILIVEDHKECAMLVSRVLEKCCGAICTTITSPTLALQHYREVNPDLILLDLHMTPLSGLDCIEKLHEFLPAADWPPIIVLTGDCSAREEVLEAGATAFLLKPFENAELVSVIRQVLSAKALAA